MWYNGEAVLMSSYFNGWKLWLQRLMWFETSVRCWKRIVPVSIAVWHVEYIKKTTGLFRKNDSVRTEITCVNGIRFNGDRDCFTYGSWTFLCQVQMRDIALCWCPVITASTLGHNRVHKTLCMLPYFIFYFTRWQGYSTFILPYSHRKSTYTFPSLNGI